jgi:uncharacterized protein (DUF58 family)
VLTGRGRVTLVLGLALYVGAWAFGATAVYPVAVGMVLASGLAWGWVLLLQRPLELRRLAVGGERVEGDDVPVGIELVPQGRLAPSSVVLSERIARVGEVEVVARRSRRGLTGRYVLPRLPRGRYAHEASTAVVEDPFGLARAEVELSADGALLVYPRLVPLDGLFSEAGSATSGGRRLYLRRPSGFDLHSVRDHQQGESLRRVHWASTARRGRLMVKELEDEPRDEVAVLLDAAADAVVGSPPDSTFDVQVRAAGSILRAHAERGRRSVLVVNSLAREAQRLDGDDGDWQRARELLASVEPTGVVRASSLLGDDAAGPAARALELTVITARLTPDLVERLVQRATAGRPVSVVYVDGPSFAAVPAAGREPALLRLQALGVPVAVVRKGDDLRAALGAAVAPEAASG